MKTSKLQHLIRIVSAIWPTWAFCGALCAIGALIFPGYALTALAAFIAFGVGASVVYCVLEFYRDQMRNWPWLASGVVFAGLVWLLAPHQLGVLAWSLSKLGLGAYLGYWIDRSVFYYARPGTFYEMSRQLVDAGDKRGGRIMRRDAGVASLRRVGIMAAAILALGLGV